MNRLWERFQVCPLKEAYIFPEGPCLGTDQVAEAVRIQSAVLRKWNDTDKKLMREIERQIERDAQTISSLTGMHFSSDLYNRD